MEAPLFYRMKSFKQDSLCEFLSLSAHLLSIYSVNTGLDSFILFNDEKLSEQVTLTELMADREEEVNTTEVSKQFVAFENISKPNIGLELQVMSPLLLNLDSRASIPQINENIGQLEQFQLSVDI